MHYGLFYKCFFLVPVAPFAVCQSELGLMAGLRKLGKIIYQFVLCEAVYSFSFFLGTDPDWCAGVIPTFPES